PYEVRRLVTDLTWRREDIAERLASPDFPGLLLRDPDVTRVVRRSGGTIALNGVPLTTAGWRRIRQWRQEWLALPSQAGTRSQGSLIRPRAGRMRACAACSGGAVVRRVGEAGLSRHCLLNFYYGY